MGQGELQMLQLLISDI